VAVVKVGESNKTNKNTVSIVTVYIAIDFFVGLYIMNVSPMEKIPL